MNIKELKLIIIQSVTACGNPELLQTIQQMLEKFDQNASSPSGSKADQQALLNVLLQEKPAKTNTPPASTADLQDLQDSIDEVFGKH